MSLLLKPLRPNFEAALRDVEATSADMRAHAALRLGDLRDANPPETAQARAVEGLLKLATDKEAKVRLAAMQSLAVLRDASSLEVVLARFSDEDSAVREAAVVAAGEIGGERARDALRVAVMDTRPEVRFQGIAAYGKVAGEQARASISVALGDDDPLVRISAIESLAELGPSEDACVRIARLLTNQPPEVIEEAALALGQLKDKRAIPQLTKMIHGPRTYEAMSFLGDLKATDASDSLAQVAEAFLRPLLVKAAAATALIRIGDARGPALFHAILHAWRNEARTYCVSVIGELQLQEHVETVIQMLDKPRGAEAKTVVETLHKLAKVNERARTTLEGLAEHPGVLGALAREVQGRSAGG